MAPITGERGFRIDGEAIVAFAEEYIKIRRAHRQPNHIDCLLRPSGGVVEGGNGRVGIMRRSGFVSKIG